MNSRKTCRAVGLAKAEERRERKEKDEPQDVRRFTQIGLLKPNNTLILESHIHQ